ncbi:hypothetical protein MKQ70_12535 [Chitinophaga sedimenti]|uniref:hypothetical protein n=1 Tax=Chitinophaga sedimenti TaxID=2033606 RepID=UPI0020059CEF|nr:hypothetical protein [Chitinophaga sedimenti]MCK7555799.1 hypothetical protein [Chitinophaga sedimenti]
MMFSAPDPRHESIKGVSRTPNGRLEVCELPLHAVLPLVDDQPLLIRTVAKAAVFAKTILQDLDIRAIYQRLCNNKVSAYKKAVSDFYHAPVIRKIQGGPASLHVWAEDDVMVVAVNVQVYDKEGRLLEGGPAVIADHLPWWRYRFSNRDTGFKMCTAVVTAADLPGNVTRKVFVS